MNTTPKEAHALRLPLDLLEEFFSSFVQRDEVSPVLLSHVCRQWRDVARHSGRLWTNIDLAYPERAKHFIDLSREAQLYVVWNNRSPRSYGALWISKRDWIWLHASRFAVLELAASSHVIQHIVSQIGDHLPLLKSMVIICDDTSVQPAQWIPISLACDMPRLHSLSLSNFKTNTADFVRVLEHSPLLDILELHNVLMQNIDAVDQSSFRGLRSRSLRSMSLTSVGAFCQWHLISYLGLPTSSLILSERATDAGWDEIAHPLLRQELANANISFSRLDFHSRYTMLVGQISGGACEVRISLLWPAYGFLPIHFVPNPFDMSQVHTLDIAGTSDFVHFDLHASWNLLTAAVPHTHTLILRGLESACDFVGQGLHELQEVVFHSVNLDSPDFSDPRAMIVAHALRYRGQPVKRLILNKSRWPEEIVTLFRTSVEDVIMKN